MGNQVTAEELLLKGGRWLGALRNRIKWMRCGPLANGERVTWGSDDRIEPPLSVREVEELGAEAAAAALVDEQVEIDRLHAEVARLKSRRPVRCPTCRGDGRIREPTDYGALWRSCEECGHDGCGPGVVWAEKTEDKS